VGNGSFSSPQKVPVEVKKSTGSSLSAYEIELGGDFSCASDWGNTVWCWGSDEEGQLGNGSATTSKQNKPVTLFRSLNGPLALGEKHACVVVCDDFTFSCWPICSGYDFYGQLGNGNPKENVSTAAFVSLFVDVYRLFAGRDHTCAKDFDDAVWCWGKNNYRQLGDGTDVHRVSPTLIFSACP
jgi:alpha-tubulin suppressor-like RCC1 family protein